jgi:hypothetical protein
MKKIAVSQILDGMILAQPVSGPGGNVLIGKGSVLKGSLGSRLSGWGVDSLWIESEESETSIEQTVPHLPSVKERIDRIFEGRLVNPAMKMIYHAIQKHSGCEHDA